jgi:D-methionine transport system permease protein
MSSELINLFASSFFETLIMVGISSGVGALLGIPLGIVLNVTDEHGILPHPMFNRVMGLLVNAVRSTPFIILLVAVIPFTRLITGTSIGTGAAVVPLTIAATPFVARLVEAALREVDPGLVEAAQAMGATDRQIIWKILLPEAFPGIIAGLTITVVSLVGYSAMAGAVGGGGLGDLGIRYGYQRFLPEVMGAVVLILIAFVQIVQSLGDRLVRHVSHRGRSVPANA